MITTTRHFTLADLAALPDDSPIYDVREGALVVRNVLNDSHAVVLSALAMYLGRADEAGFGEFYTSSRAVALDYPERGEAAKDVSHPDLFFIRKGREALRGWRAIEGVPDLIVEVLSHTTRDEHEPGGDLYEMYARHGVPYYWVADPLARTITRYTLVGEPYVGGHYGEAVVLTVGDVLTCPLFPSITVPVAHIFRRVRDVER